MADCLNCRLATWKTTTAGRLHPSGDGKCGYRWIAPPISAAQYWIGGAGQPAGGHIERRRLPERDCPVFEPRDVEGER